MWTSPPWPERLCGASATDSPASGFNGNTCAILTAIDEQSGDIAMGVDSSYDFAGDTAPVTRA